MLLNLPAIGVITDRKIVTKNYSTAKCLGARVWLVKTPTMGNTERNRFDTPLRIEICLRSVLSPIAKSLLKDYSTAKCLGARVWLVKTPTMGKQHPMNAEALAGDSAKKKSTVLRASSAKGCYSLKFFSLPAPFL